MPLFLTDLLAWRPKMPSAQTIAAAVVGVFLFGSGIWWEHRPHTPAPLSWVLGQGLGYQLKTIKAQDKAALDAAVKHVAAVGAASKAASVKIVGANKVTQAGIAAVTAANAKEIPTYVPSRANAGCTVNRGAVRLLNATASGRTVPEVPAAAAGTGHAGEAVGAAAGAAELAEPSGVQFSELVGVVNRNTGVCLAEEADRQAMRALWHANEAAFAIKP